ARGIGRRGRGRYRVYTPFPMKRPTLLTQVLAVNALLITATVFSASVAASLHSDPIIERKRFLVLVAALMAMVLVNGWLLRRRFAPLEELIDAMERVDFGGRDPRSAIPTANVEEVARLHRAFDRMLERLEAERDRTATAVLKAQVGELVRLARDLRPVALDDLGLGAALRTQVAEFGRRAGLVTSLTIPAAGLEDLDARSEEHTSELQSRSDLVCRLLL